MPSSLVWDLVNPEGAAQSSVVTPAARPSDLNHKTIGLAWNGKPGGQDALEEIARLLHEQFAGLHFVKYWEVLPESVAPRELTAATIQAMADHRPDLVLVAQAD
ncbi:MAG: hypothetical protein JO318_11075 [Chloroflexi bacterium]|nr:hypothetical protein [Chloroflexota bacterium]